jgi:hypothetical protein
MNLKVECMAYLKSEATEEFKNAVLSVERRSDDCWKQMRLLKQPRNVATWALLTSIALELELVQQDYGADSLAHRNAATVWDLCTCGFVFIATQGKAESKFIRKYSLNGMLKSDAQSDLLICREYTNFLNIFPRWHRYLQRADILPDGRVRFAFERDSPRQRQVIAFQQRAHPSKNMQGAPSRARMTLTSEQEQLFADLHNATRSKGLARKFAYEPSRELLEAVRPHFQQRLDDSFRHSGDFELDGYTLDEFKLLYVGLLILCGIHERVCYPFKDKGYPIPQSSLVMVKPRGVWITKLVSLSGLSQQICEKIIDHLTMDPSPGKATGMAIHPFVPLDRYNQDLAVAPQFPLAANSDDNILRAFSYRDQAKFSGANTGKEATLRGRLLAANSRFNIPDPMNLPDRSTNIDLIIEDQQSSTLVLAELKWIRKPVKTWERAERDAEVDKGIGQVRKIRNYARAHPDFLKVSRRLTRDIGSYANVHYLLIVADHWFWVDPEDNFAILDFQVFLTNFARSTNLQSTISDLVTYDWLPVEGVNFNVAFAPSSVNGAVIESPTFNHLK